MEYKCLYCKLWNDSSKKIKNTTSNEKIKKCLANKTVTAASKACKYFNPNQVFYCDKNSIRLDVINCLSRRRNSKEFSAFENCKKCRQFELEIKDFVIKYIIEGKQAKERKGRKKIITENKEVKIKRRNKKIKIKERIKSTNKKRKRIKI